jgi:hypothetical protein
VEGTERLRWHFSKAHPRPFFYPLNGPSGRSLTRIGHPGAPNHDHHRSVWFAHHDVLGIDFWSDQTPSFIRQQEWLCYQDGQEEAVMACRLGWFDGHDPQPLLEQELVAAVRPASDGGTLLELQFTMRPVAEMLEFGKTNFGFLAVRVAKSISAYFGGGQLTSSQGRHGEPEIFAHPARWVDYSGPTADDTREGITYFDHVANPNYPARWHVREDGWMGASVCMDAPVVTRREAPLSLRYLLHAHSGDVDTEQAERIAGEFCDRPAFRVRKSDRKHTAYEADRS